MEDQEKWGIFWMRLLYPVIYEEREDVSAYFKEISQQQVAFPNGEKKKPSISTLWRKLRAYRRNGYHNLKRKQRSDRGGIRAVSQEIIDKAVELKKDLPSRSAPVINDFLLSYYGKEVAESTLYRHLRHASATKIKLGVAKKPVRCRWTRKHSNSLWVGDFEYGPYVLIDGTSHRSYLSAFIDMHSRFVVDARYYLRTNKPILIDTLLRAWSIQGLPMCIYVDNAKVYHSPQLEQACASLEIKLLHRPPRQPESGGIIEKFFQTVQSQFESEVRAGDILDLDRLNRTFSAWLNVAYHERIHRETGQSPKERYQSGMLGKRVVDMETAVRFFMKKATRKVHRDFSDISLEGRLYRVDSKLRGDTIIVYWDEFADGQSVLIYSLQKIYLGIGQLHQREKGELTADAQTAKPQHDYLKLLVEKHQQQLRARSQGIDYTYATHNRPWPFVKFLTAMAHLLKRKGGATAFSTNELEALDKAYRRFPNFNDSMLEEAFVNAEYKDIVNIVHQLQLLNHDKGN